MLWRLLFIGSVLLTVCSTSEAEQNHYQVRRYKKRTGSVHDVALGVDCAPLGYYGSGKKLTLSVQDERQFARAYAPWQSRKNGIPNYVSVSDPVRRAINEGQPFRVIYELAQTRPQIPQAFRSLGDFAWKLSTSAFVEVKLPGNKILRHELRGAIDGYSLERATERPIGLLLQALPSE
ncbi:MAG: hypothetical protein H6707_04020 [Deltaproteobacteria bacterium]|nr:hypothetical protein [Deltaproteobacteria bacterium]